MDHIQMQEKCTLIEKMGFRVIHEDSKVSWKGFDFNFASVEADMPSIFESAMRQMWTYGFDSGEKSMQQDFRNLLGIQEQTE